MLDTFWWISLLAKRVSDDSPVVTSASASVAPAAPASRTTSSARRSAAAGSAPMPSRPLMPPPQRARCGTGRPRRRARRGRSGRVRPCRSSACPTSPGRGVTHGVHRPPQLVGDPGVGPVAEQPAHLAALDLAADLGAELEVEPAVVDGPAAVRLEQEAVVRVRDDVLEAHARLRQQVHVRHPDQRDAIPAVRPHRPAGLAADPRGRLAGAEVAGEHALLHEWHLLGRDALVVPAEGAQAARDRGVGDDVAQVRAVAEAAEHVRREEAGARVAGLAAEGSIELRRVAAALVHLHVELAGVQEDGARAGGEGRGGQQLDGLRRDALRVVRQLQAPDPLVACRRPGAAVVRPAPALVLVALDGVGLQAAADVGDHLLGVAAVGGGEGLPLALGGVERLRPGDALDLVHRAVGGEEVRDLAFQGDLERVLSHWGFEAADGRRAAVQEDGIPEGGGARLRDADGLGGHAVRLCRGEVVAGGESPGTVHEDADAEALALAGLDALHAGGLDVDRFLEPPDHAHIGVRRAQGRGRVEGTARQISHWDRG